jgi:hypothetical protein
MSTAANAAQPVGTSREGLPTRHPLVFYFVIAYGSSWLLALPYVRFLTWCWALTVSLAGTFSGVCRRYSLCRSIPCSLHHHRA